MTDRRAFQSQLASIMEVLANAAVAEICKLVEDDYAVVSLQMSQCQRENKGLKRKLHLLELKMARGYAERRLREAGLGGGGRARVHVLSGERQPAAPAHNPGVVFDRQMNMGLWPGGPAPNTTNNNNIHAAMQDESADVQLVEPEPLMVKEEKVERAEELAEVEEDIPLIGEDGVVECHRGVRGAGPQDSQSSSSQTQSTAHMAPAAAQRTPRPTGGARGVEAAEVEKEEPDVVLVKVEEAEAEHTASLSIQEGLVESSTDDFRAALPLEETGQPSANQLGDLQGCGRGFSECAEQSLKSEGCSLLSGHTVVPDSDCSEVVVKPRSSDYSLFELETFFTRWAPDRDSLSPPAGPSCSYSAEEAGEDDLDDVVMVTETQSPLLLQASPSADRPTAGEGSSRPRAPGAGPVPVRLQAPPSQLPWNRAAAMMRTVQTQSLLHQQQGRFGNRPAQPQGDGLLPGRPASSVALPVRGSLSSKGLAGMEAALAAQQRQRALNRLAAVGAGERRRKSYVCRACGKAFTGLSNLEAHQRVHTGERPFRCSTCGKSFSEAGNLKKHQRVHTGEKPYSCEGCGKRFAWICNLRTHQQSATGCGAMGGVAGGPGGAAGCGFEGFEP